MGFYFFFGLKRSMVSLKSSVLQDREGLANYTLLQKIGWQEGILRNFDTSAAFGSFSSMRVFPILSFHCVLFYYQASS